MAGIEIFQLTVLLNRTRVKRKTVLYIRLQAEYKYYDLQKGGFKDPLNKIPIYLNVSLIDLKLRNNKVVYWLATKNFFAITKYNRSYKYAACFRAC